MRDADVCGLLVSVIVVSPAKCWKTDCLSIYDFLSLDMSLQTTVVSCWIGPLHHVVALVMHREVDTDRHSKPRWEKQTRRTLICC